MAKIVRGLIFWPLLMLFVVLAIANQSLVQISFDPFNGDKPTFAITLPVFVVLLAGLALGILLGGLSTWADQGHWRRAARQYQKRVQALEAQAAATVMPSPTLAPSASQTASVKGALTVVR